MPLSELDRRLLDRCLKYESGAWRDFVDRYLGLTYHVIQHAAHARSMQLKPEEVEDIAAKIFGGLSADDFKALRQFRGTSALPIYLTIVARRLCIKELVKLHREAELGHVTGSRTALAEESAEDLEPIAKPDEVARMLKLVDDREAEVVRLYHLESLNSRQIAKQLGVPENTIRPILAKARRGIR